MAAASSLYVGVDVGGTNITAALIEATGTIVARHRNRTPRTGKPKDAVAAILKTIDELLAEASVKSKDLVAIGLGVPGIVDTEAGRVVLTPNMNLSNLKMVEPLEKEFGVRTILGNDVDLGTLGEKWLGAARNARSAVGIFVGTGIGGGVIVDGKLLRGARLAGGEIGHIVMEMDGPLCGCGNRGCLEALASRSAIERDIRDAVAAGRESAITELLDGDLALIKSGALKRALKMDDPLVTEVLAKASKILGYACLTVRHLLDPDVIVLGGGVIEACGDFIVPIVQRIVAADALPGACDGGHVVRSELGDDAGVLGAVALARQYVGEPAGAVAYPTLAAGEAGQVNVGKKIYDTDVIIRVDGRIKKRKKSDAGEKSAASHNIDVDELRRACKGAPATLIIGAGQQGAVEVTAAGEQWLREQGIDFAVLPNAKAADAYNEASGRKAALIHVTC